MSFRLWTIFYVFALVAAALATFGGGGIVAALLVFGFWAWVFYAPTKITLVEFAVILMVIGTLVALLIPAVQSSGGSRRRQCQNHLRQIAIALLNYEVAKKKLPPAYTADAEGNPMHSWRVLILPYLQGLSLYVQYDFDEPWNGPNNSKLMSQMPQEYQCPSHGDGAAPGNFEASYFAVVGPEAAAGDNSRTLSEITDGMDQTIALIEASGLGIQWMEPRDLTIDEAVQLLTKDPRSLPPIRYESFFTIEYHTPTLGRSVAFVDGHVDWIGQLADADIARALLTVAGGEPIPDNPPHVFPESDIVTKVNWKNVYALSVFVVLALLPAPWAVRRQPSATTKTVGANG